jgi:hypothetical protein
MTDVAAAIIGYGTDWRSKLLGILEQQERLGIDAGFPGDLRFLGNLRPLP